MTSGRVHIYTDSRELPQACDAGFFHSGTLFSIYEQTPRMKPYMAVVEDASGKAVAWLLAVVRYRASLFPPYLYSHCRILGEGCYTDVVACREQTYSLMLGALVRKLGSRVLFTEISNLSNKMFGYKAMRREHFFPVRWMSIHNSLHNKLPEERISERQYQRVLAAQARGVTVREVSDAEDMAGFNRLIRRHNRLKLRRYTPDGTFFQALRDVPDVKLYVTEFHGRVIGCCACVWSGGNAYLWYLASLRKSFAACHPDTLTVWHAIKCAHAAGLSHVYFMDVGLPFMRNPFREFILSFGGKPVSTFRWFRTSFPWLDRLLSWLFS